MDRTTFEALRDLPGKVISGDIRFARRAVLAPLLVAEGIRIDNTDGVELVLTVSQVFTEFCRIARIEHLGQLDPPDEAV